MQLSYTINTIKLIIVSILLIFAAAAKALDTPIRFVTSADYPPFEYRQDGQLVGFDIELAKLIAQELKQPVEFKEMQFNNMMFAIQNQLADAAIATITRTPARQKNFDFSEPYYTEKMALVFADDNTIDAVEQLQNKKVACQLGTTMHIWLQQHAPDSTTIFTVDSTLQAIESLKAHHVDAVLVDAVQGRTFSSKHDDLGYKIISTADDPYCIVLKKNSPLTKQINAALQTIKQRGLLEQLQQKYLTP